MIIAIIGPGLMGKALAKRLAAAGEDVVLAGLDLKKTSEAAKEAGASVKARTPSAAASADVVIIAVPWPSVVDALKSAGDLSGKVIIDMTNAVGPNLSQAVTGENSVAEEIQKRVPGAKVVKAFNTIFGSLFEETGAPPLQVLYAGDDPEAKETVAALIREVGFEPVDAGPLENARQIEALGNLIIKFRYGLGRGSNLAWGLANYD